MSGPTVAEIVISRFGGLYPLARALGKTVSTVQRWQEKGTIPLRNWPDVEAAAFKEGFFDLTARRLGELHGAQEVTRRALKDAADADDKTVKCEVP